MIKSFTDQIPIGSKIAIFGAGISGCGLKKYIEQNRKDIKILFFVDTFLTGEKDNLPIIPSSKLDEYKSEIDIIICATRNMLYDILTAFEYIQIPYIYITPYIENYYKYEKYIESQINASNIFPEKEDKDLYNLIWQQRLDPTKTAIQDYVQKHGISYSTIPRNYGKQYLEYIDKDSIETIFDAGFCNRINSLMFKKQLNNLKTLYAFEPSYEKFKNPLYDKLIKKADFCKIIEKGLWETEKKLYFAENISDPSCCRVIEDEKQLKSNENLTIIDATTVDNFRFQNDIEKVDFIKMDIEGAELPVLKGSLKTIKKDRPQLAISIYHSIKDFIEIPLYLNKELENYTFKLGHYSPRLIETVLYAIPNELYKGEN